MVTAEQDTPENDATAIFRRILVPVDFSMASHQGVFLALELRRLYGSKICVFHATHGGENDQFLAGLGSPASASDLIDTSPVRRFLNNIAPEQSDAVECDTAMEDDYVTSIHAKAKKWEATLVVLSHESHPSLLRTHSEKLMKVLDVPVLVFPTAASSKA